jgi:hypothetical protein
VKFAGTCIVCTRIKKVGASASGPKRNVRLSLKHTLLKKREGKTPHSSLLHMSPPHVGFLDVPQDNIHFGEIVMKLSLIGLVAAGAIGSSAFASFAMQPSQSPQLAVDLPPLQPPHLLAVDLPPLQPPHLLAVDLPPLQPPHLLAVDLPPLQPPHLLAVDLPPLQPPHLLAVDLPPLQPPHLA